MIQRCIRYLVILLNCTTFVQTQAMFMLEEEEISERPETPAIDKHDALGKTQLGYAIEEGQHEQVRQLLLDGANPNAETHGKSPLMLALEKSNVTMVDLVLLFGGRDSDSYELFHQAIRARSVPIIKSLVRSHCDINVPGPEHTLPLFDAIADGQMDVIETCLELGADLRLKDGKNRTVFDFINALENEPVHGWKMSCKNLRKLDEFKDDDEAEKNRITGEEIVELCMIYKKFWDDNYERLAKVKLQVQRLGMMPTQEAFDAFSQLDREMQKDVALFVPLRLKDVCTPASVRKSPIKELERGEANGDGGSSCVMM